GCDDLTTHLADLARGMRLVVVRQGAVLVAHRVVFRRAAQVFQQPFLDLVPAEIRWGCHACLPKVQGGHPAAGPQSRTWAASQAITWPYEIDLFRPGAVAAAFARATGRRPAEGCCRGQMRRSCRFLLPKRYLLLLPGVWTVTYKNGGTRRR